MLMPTTSASNKCRWKHKSKDNDFFFFNKKIASWNWQSTFKNTAKFEDFNFCLLLSDSEMKKCFTV